MLIYLFIFSFAVFQGHFGVRLDFRLGICFAVVYKACKTFRLGLQVKDADVGER